MYIRNDLQAFELYKITEKVTHNLGDNENRLIDWSDVLTELGSQLTMAELSYYGDNQYSDLKAAFAESVGVRPSQVLYGVGSDQLIHILITAFIGATDTFVTVSPDFFMYGVFAQMQGVPMQEFPMTWTAGLPHFEVEDLLAYAQSVQAKMIMLSNPNNPTSVAFDSQKLEQLVQDFDGLVVIDEAYIEFADVASLLDKVNQYDNLIILRTMSKAYGLAGLRLGFAVACEGLIDQLDRVMPPYSMPNIVAKFGQLALQEQARVTEAVATIKAIREEFMAFLASDAETVVLPSQTNFVTFFSPDAPAIFQKGKEAGFAFKYYQAGPMAGGIRMAIGRADEMAKMTELITNIRGNDRN